MASINSEQGRDRPPVAVEETNVGVFTGDFDRSSWGAILAGTICGVAIYLALGLIGLAAGIGVVDPAEEAQPLAGVPYGVGVWWAVSALAAFFAGGLIAGRLAGFPTRTSGALHGLTVGSLTLLFVTYIATTTVGSAVSGAAGAASQLFAGSGRQEVLVNVAVPNVQRATGSQGSGNTQGQSGQRNTGNRPSLQEANAGNSQAGGSPSRHNYDNAIRLQDLAIRQIRLEAIDMLGNLFSQRERERLQQEASATYKDLLRTPGDADRDIKQLFEFLLSNDGVLGPEDRREAKRLLTERLGIQPSDADLVLSRWQARYEGAVKDLQKLVDDASEQLTQFMPEDAGSRRSGSNRSSQADQSNPVRRVVSRQEQAQTRKIVSNTVEDIQNNPRSAVGELQIMFERLFSKNGPWGEEDLAELRTVLRERTGLTEEAVDRATARWQAQYAKAVNQVQDAYGEVRRETIAATDQALDLMASTAAWTAFALFVALIASTAGGMIAVPVGNAPFSTEQMFRRRRDDDDDDGDED